MSSPVLSLSYQKSMLLLIKTACSDKPVYTDIIKAGLLPAGGWTRVVRPDPISLLVLT